MKITIIDAFNKKKHLNLKRVEDISSGLIISWQLMDVVNLKDTWKVIFLPHKSRYSYGIASFLGDNLDEIWSDLATKEEIEWINQNKPRYLKERDGKTIPSKPPYHL